jgi:hypothetical protein
MDEGNAVKKRRCTTLLPVFFCIAMAPVFAQTA